MHRRAKILLKNWKENNYREIRYSDSLARANEIMPEFKIKPGSHGIQNPF